MFDLNDIAIFIKVVEAGSFTGAARLLCVPKTTVSRQVARLEANLSMRLLARTTRKLSLTEAGEIYFQRCRQILNDIEATNNAIASLQSLPQGTLRITAPVVFGRQFLAEWVIDFSQRYNQINGEVLLTNKYVDLLAERIDLAFRFDPQKENFLIRQLKSICYWVCASPEYFSKYGEPQTPQALSQHRCIVLDNSLGTKKWRLVSTTVEVVAVSSCLKVNDLMLAKQAALAGVGIAYLPNTLVADSIASGRLSRVLSNWSSNQRQLCVVCPSVGVVTSWKDNHLPPKVQAFLNLIDEKLPLEL